MSRSAVANSSQKLVVIDLPIDRAYVRSIFIGVAAFARTRPDWRIFQAVRTGEDWRDVFRSHRPDGLIWNLPTVREFQARRKFCPHIVDISGRCRHDLAPRVTPDNVAIGRLAAQHLLDTGIRQMAYVGYKGLWYSELRLQGFREVCEAKNLQVAIFDRAATFESYTQTDTRIEAFLKGLPRPIGVFAANDNLALRVMQSCRNAALRVPDDVAVLGCDNDELAAALSDPPLSSISLAAEKVGFEAAAALARRMDGRADAPLPPPLLLPPVGVVRRTSTDLLTVPDADVAEALRFIAGHAHDNVRVTDVIRHVMLSRRTLELRFRDLLGKTPAEAIRQAQISRAMELLNATDRSIPTVARQCGFVNTKHFARSFRKHTGKSPTAYRSTFKRV